MPTKGAKPMTPQEKNMCPVCKHEIEEVKGGESFSSSTIQAWTIVILYNQLMTMHRKLRETEEADLALLEQCRLHGETIAHIYDAVKLF